MFFLTNQNKAQFCNRSQMTFLVWKDFVEIVPKVKRGVYPTDVQLGEYAQ